MNELKRKYDEHLEKLSNEKKEEIREIEEKHQSQIEATKTNLQQTFQIEHQAQTKYYLKIIDEMKIEHERLLNQQKSETVNKQQLDEEFLNERRRFVELEKRFDEFRAESAVLLDEEKTKFQRQIEENEKLRNQIELFKRDFLNESDHIGKLNEQIIEQRNQIEQLAEKLEKADRQIDSFQNLIQQKNLELQENLRKKSSFSFSSNENFSSLFRNDQRKRID